MKALALILLSVSAFAAVNGTVTNTTTGKPQGGVIIQMVQPGQGGMQTLGTSKSAPDGTFKFEKDAEGPRLLQAFYQGVMFTTMIPPGAASSGVKINITDATTDPSVVKASEHIYIVQPTAEGITVEEAVFLKNDSNKTFNDPKGTFRFYLPENIAGIPKVSLTSPDGMVPVQREASKTNKPNVYSVSYPLKPGETRVSISYGVQPGANRSFSTRLLQEGGTNRLVVPLGVTVEGDNLKLMGQDPQNKANIYDITGKEFAAVLKGDASTNVAGGGGGASSGGDEPEDTGAPQVTQSNPRIYDRFWPVLALGLGILAVGFVLMYRATPRKGAAPK